ncbi:hypothetical protein QQ020_25270 [Fulvivirgaceae bacterium BMA12]|uniref:Tetratricopeptide repeat protein n=1 Tax=Agaribacillus aureus TaxID=3051825 RepID=A0ABT8LCA8_9BACT|nr:hypothetical protein [Fulvivirgaceae bacterium BMA12]
MEPYRPLQTLSARRMMACLLCCILSSTICIAQQDDLGNIDFPTSGKAIAQNDFIMGMLLLHSFEYDDAAEFFRKAQKKDPDFAMAYWGEAMTYNHPIWFQQEKNRAISALNKIAPTPIERLQKCQLPIEKALMAAADVLYGAGSKKERDLEYMGFLKSLHDKHPGNHEIACFYALSLMGSRHNGRHIPTYLEAAGITEKVLEKNPRHPGALHYTIHAYDEPAHAHLGLPAANAYARVAPGSEHALHMPSHIFVALGMWNEVVASNEASWEAGEQRVERKKLHHSQRAYHSLLWLTYGYLQQERFEAAKKMIAIIQDDVKHHTTRRAKVHLNQMRAAYLVNSRKWDDDVGDIKINLEGTGLVNASLNAFINGMVVLERNDVANAEKMVREIAGMRQKKAPETLDANLTMCYAPGTMPKKTQEARTSLILENELQAAIFIKQDKLSEAESILKKAIALEENMSFSFGPPVIAKPPQELYGEFLLANNRPEEALAQFEKVFERAPKRTLALRGYAAAASRSNKPLKAREALNMLNEISIAEHH